MLRMFTFNWLLLKVTILGLKWLSNVLATCRTKDGVGQYLRIKMSVVLVQRFLVCANIESSVATGT